MKINLKCLAGLSKNYDCDYRQSTVVDLERGATVHRAIGRSGVPQEEVRIVFVNGKIAHSQQNLNDDDRVTLVPATGGM